MEDVEVSWGKSQVHHLRRCSFMEEGWDYLTGRELYFVSQVESAADCCDECDKEKNCSAWAWGAARNTSNLTDVCYLKALPDGQRAIRARNPMITSGLPWRSDPQNCLHQIWEECGKVEDSIEYHTGMDLWSVDKIENPEQCCKYCNEHLACRAWTWGKDEDKAKGLPHIPGVSKVCFVKGLRAGSKPKKINNTNVVSGSPRKLHMDLSETLGSHGECGKIENDWVYNTSVELRTVVNIESAEMCCGFCEGYPECHAWTWMWDKHECYLKSFGKGPHNVTRSNNTLAVSGLPSQKVMKWGFRAAQGSNTEPDQGVIAREVNTGTVNQRCPGTIQVDGYGPVRLNNLVEEHPKEKQGMAQVRLGSEVVAPMMARTYFANVCSANQYDRNNYVALNLLGKSFKYTTDISGAGCGCNAALYLTNMRQNTKPSELNDYYCDANKVGGVACAEIDIQEANQYSWLSTLHAYNSTYGNNGADALGLGLGYGGSQGHPLRRDWNSEKYGPGGSCVDTQRPFEVSVAFHTNAKGDFTAFEVQLSQEGGSCILSAYHKRYQVLGRGNVFLVEQRDGMAELAAALKEGMTPIISYWGADDMLWMDGIGGDGRGACVEDHHQNCTASVRFYNFAIESLTAEAPDR